MVSCFWVAGTLVARAADDGTVVDLTRVFVYANAETIAMGGAGSAFAFGGNGMIGNPAAPANRRIETTSAIFTSGTLTVTSPGETKDVWNLGEPLDQTTHLYNVTGTIGYRRAAVGAYLGGTWYQQPDSFFGSAEGHTDVAYAFGDGRVIAGAGARMLGIRTVENGEHVDHFGAGAEMGAIVPNVWEHWNFALALRSGVHAETQSDQDVPFDGARVPPEAQVGVGWSTGSRVSHPVRVAADVVVDGALKDTVSLEKVLAGEIVPRGENPTISPRAGAEVEVWHDRLRLRGGTYLEPARTESSKSRGHATGGFEVHLIELRFLQDRVKFDLAWQMGADWAPRYLHTAFIGLNIWGSGAVGGAYAPKAGVD